MPKKDPVTGCMVMTWAEFWEHEGEVRGTSAAEEMDSFFEQMNEEVERDRQMLHDHAFENVVHQMEQHNEWCDEKLVVPASLVQVLGVELREGFRGTSQRVSIIATMPDGTQRIIHSWFEEDFGSRMEPGWAEGEVWFE